MPNRIIRESCRTSPTLALLSHGAERMFWRLTTVADDFGRFEADPVILKSTCFASMADSVKTKEVKAWFEELVACSLVTTYAVNGKQYGFFNTWQTHQYTRAKTSKFPAPSSDNIREQTPANVPVFGSTVTTVSTEKHEESGSIPPHTPTWGTPEALIGLYNEATPEECPSVETLSPGRREKAKRYLTAFPAEEFWRQVFREIGQSKFLRGLAKRDGQHAFVADFDWLLSKGKDGSENCAKTHDGRYRDGAYTNGQDRRNPGTSDSAVPLRRGSVGRVGLVRGGQRLPP